MTADARLLGSERSADHDWSAHDNEEEDKLGHLL